MRPEPVSRRGIDSLLRRGGSIASGLLLLALVDPGATAAWADEAGKRQFLTSCGTCHTVEKGAPHRQGPNLYGIFDRKAGEIAGFEYSQVLAGADLTWDEATLDRWIENASAMLPGTIMAYRQRDPDKRRLVIDFLKSIGP